VGEEVARHDKVLAASVKSRRKVLALGVDELQPFTNTLSISPISVDQLIGRSNQPQHSLLYLLHDSFYLCIIIIIIII